MGYNKSGMATKNAFADALMELMLRKDPRKITIEELADRVGMNRQTFYYHFDDIYDLAGYAYDRCVARCFNCETFEETYRDFNSRHCPAIVRGLDGGIPQMRELALFVHEQNPKGHFFEVVKRNTIALMEYGMPQRVVWTPRRDPVFDMLTSLHTTALIDWMRGATRVSGGDVLKVEHAVNEAFMPFFLQGRSIPEEE